MFSINGNSTVTVIGNSTWLISIHFWNRFEYIKDKSKFYVLLNVAKVTLVTVNNPLKM